MKIHTKDEFKIFIIGNYLFNYHGFDDTVFDHSSYYGVYNVNPKMLENIEKSTGIEMYAKEINSPYFVDVVIANQRIHYINHKCSKESLIENGYRLIGGRFFIPKYLHRYDYFINRMLDTIDSLKSRWKYEFAPLIKKIRTPEQVRQDVFVSRVSFGVEDYEDSESAGMMAMLRRTNIYHYLINSFHAQFIHLIGSVIEDAFIKGLSNKGLDISNFNRNILYEIVFNITNKTYENIPNSDDYTKFIVLWNFLKHNNKTSFDEVKKYCPEYLLHDKNFLEYGHSSQNYVRVDEVLIYKILDGLKRFFISFSDFVYAEKINEAEWNYFDYFVDEAYFTYKWELMPT